MLADLKELLYEEGEEELWKHITQNIEECRNFTSQALSDVAGSMQEQKAAAEDSNSRKRQAEMEKEKGKDDDDDIEKESPTKKQRMDENTTKTPVKKVIKRRGSSNKKTKKKIFQNTSEAKTQLSMHQFLKKD